MRIDLFFFSLIGKDNLMYRPTPIDREWYEIEIERLYNTFGLSSNWEKARVFWEVIVRPQRWTHIEMKHVVNKTILNYHDMPTFGVISSFWEKEAEVQYRGGQNEIKINLNVVTSKHDQEEIKKKYQDYIMSKKDV